MNKDIYVIELKTPVKSLCWDGDNLIDFADGGNIYLLDGTALRSQYFTAYDFDAALISPTRRFSAAYEKLGTKGIIFRGSKIIREINRSYYCAGSYEYPIAFFQLPDGREVIAHCPDEYNKLEIEELETGKSLTKRDSEPDDFFHSRLTVSEDGKFLLSAGWYWHPFDWVEVFNTKAILENSELLNVTSQYSNTSRMLDSSSEINSACFLNNTTLLLCSEQGAEDFDEGEPEEERRSPMRPGTFGFVDLYARKLTRTVTISAKVGTMFALDDKHILGIYDHPKVIDIETGLIVQEWSELQTGQQNSSIIHHIDKMPPMAFDKANRRFAVAYDKKIHVLTIPNYS